MFSFDLFKKLFFYLHVGPKSIWFVGSSYVHWGHRRALSRIGGAHLGLLNRGYNVRWFGKRGMLWNDLTATVEQNIKEFPPPAFILIHLGANDICRTKSFDLIEDMKRDLLKISILLPNTHIIWSDLIMRRYWHWADEGKAAEIIRKRINSAINSYLSKENHYVVNHPNIRAKERDLYRFDGTHLSDLGNDIWLNNIQGVLDTLIY